MSKNMTKAARLTFVVVMILVLAGAVAMPALAGDKEDIVGRWDHPTKDDAYIRFNADGTIRAGAPSRMLEGKYRLLGDGVIEFDTPGLIWGRNKEEIKYRLSGDTLELKIAGEWMKFRRVK
jgi:hypothetical protein